MTRWSSTGNKILIYPKCKNPSELVLTLEFICDDDRRVLSEYCIETGVQVISCLKTLETKSCPEFLSRKL